MQKKFQKVVILLALCGLSLAVKLNAGTPREAQSITSSVIKATGKIYTVKFTEQELQFHGENMDRILLIVDQSALPHNQAVVIFQTIDTLKRLINAQVLAQKDK